MTIPIERGFYMPAEWFPHKNCWMQWPHDTIFANYSEIPSWSHFDINLDRNNTLYTYAFAFEPHYRKKNGYAKTLKKLYVNWTKRKGFKYITGHVEQGVSQQFNYEIEIVKIFPIWYSQKKPYEYYRRKL